MLALMVTLWSTIFRLAAVPRRTATAVRGLKDFRNSHRHLSPAQCPSYQTYGAGGAAMAIALFGTASMVAMDPTFATEAGVRQTWAGNSGSSGGSDGGGGRGGGCGG